MSTKDAQIVCRKCKETIAIEGGSCPQCGTAIRGNLPYVAGAGVGAILIILAVMNLDDLLVFGGFGLLVAAGCVFLLYDKRQRIQRVSE